MVYAHSRSSTGQTIWGRTVQSEILPRNKAKKHATPYRNTSVYRSAPHNLSLSCARSSRAWSLSLSLCVSLPLSLSLQGVGLPRKFLEKSSPPGLVSLGERERGKLLETHIIGDRWSIPALWCTWYIFQGTSTAYSPDISWSSSRVCSAWSSTC